MKIINENDPRYKFLPEIFKRFNYDNFLKILGTTFQYIIPKELVLRTYQTSSNYVTNKIDTWVSRFSIDKILRYSCDLDSQCYFDLMVLHINDTDDRPKCDTCGKLVPYGGRLTWGYNQSKYWNEVDHTFCSISHAKIYHSTHPDEYPNVALEIKNWMKRGWDQDTKIINDLSRWLAKGSPDDEAILYHGITEDDNGNRYFNFGITTYLPSRVYMQRMNGSIFIDDPKVIFKGTRESCGFLEAIIKINFNGREYLNDSEVPKFWRIFNKFSSRPLENPTLNPNDYLERE